MKIEPKRVPLIKQYHVSLHVLASARFRDDNHKNSSVCEDNSTLILVIITICVQKIKTYSCRYSYNVLVYIVPSQYFFLDMTKIHFLVKSVDQIA